MKWVKVSEQKPPINKYILILTDYHNPKSIYRCGIYVMQFENEPLDYDFDCTDNYKDGNVSAGCCELNHVSGNLTHWQELPELPEPPQ